MKQNKYDDPEFFENYSRMPRSTGGLSAAGEWPAFRALFPVLRDKKVLDLGCGFGWHCRYARERQARSVVGIDSGFTISKLSEPQPTQEILALFPEMRDETRRPIFLLIAAVKNIG
nr:hypothetical protein [Paenibacillus alkalitolerans]